MSLPKTDEQIPRGAGDLASAEAMVDEAVRLAEALMWAIYGTAEAAPANAIAGAWRDHAGLRHRLQ
jgi:hypothetical protein